MQIRVYRPETGALPTLHSKTWCADGEVYYGGSFNFSRNAPILEEHLVVVRKPEAVRAHEGWFLGLWERADGRAGEEVLREHEERFRAFWNRTDVQIVGEEWLQLEQLRAQEEPKEDPPRSPPAHRQPRPQGSLAILDGSSAGTDEMGALPAVSESPLASPGRSSGAAGEDNS